MLLGVGRGKTRGGKAKRKKDSTESAKRINVKGEGSGEKMTFIIRKRSLLKMGGGGGFYRKDAGP